MPQELGSACLIASLNTPGNEESIPVKIPCIARIRVKNHSIHDKHCLHAVRSTDVPQQKIC
jgi:hypothetical protein